MTKVVPERPRLAPPEPKVVPERVQLDLVPIPLKCNQRYRDGAYLFVASV